MHGSLVAHLFYLIFRLLERHLSTFQHGRKVEESSASVKGVDEISEAGQCDTVVLAIQILQACIDFEDVRQRAGTLHTEFLVCIQSALKKGS